MTGWGRRHRPGVFLDFRDAMPIQGKGRDRSSTATPSVGCTRITGDDPYETPMMIYPARIYAMGSGSITNSDHDPRPVRDRRGELLRPRRQPPRRLGPDGAPADAASSPHTVTSHLAEEPRAGQHSDCLLREARGRERRPGSPFRELMDVRQHLRPGLPPRRWAA